MSITHDTGYNPGYDFTMDLADGKQGEKSVIASLGLLLGDSTSWEVKKSNHPQAGTSMFVEVEQDPGRQGIYKPSGLAVTTATYWAHIVGNTGAFMVFPVELLRKWVERYAWGAVGTEVPVPGGTNGDNPTRGYIIQLSQLLEFAATHPTKEHQ